MPENRCCGGCGGFGFGGDCCWIIITYFALVATTSVTTTATK